MRFWESTLCNEHIGYIASVTFHIGAAVCGTSPGHAARSVTSASTITSSSLSTSLSFLIISAGLTNSYSDRWSSGTAPPIVVHDLYNDNGFRVLAWVGVHGLREFAAVCKILRLPSERVTRGTCWNGSLASVPSSLNEIRLGQGNDRGVVLNSATMESGRICNPWWGWPCSGTYCYSLDHFRTSEWISQIKIIEWSPSNIHLMPFSLKHTAASYVFLTIWPISFCKNGLNDFCRKQD